MTDRDQQFKKLIQKRDYFAKVFEETKQFTEDLVTENASLRELLQKTKKQLDENSQSPAAQQQVSALATENERLRNKLAELKGNLDEVEEENREFAEKYLSIEYQNNNLASLYVASYRLHSTLVFHQVLDIIREIVINLIGSEAFGIYLQESDGHLNLATHEGLDDHEPKQVKAGEKIEGTVFQSGEDFFITDVNQASKGDPIACFGLKIHNECIGVIAIYELLSHKEKFEDLDFEICSLLASHAATAIYSSQLFTQVERKLDTYKSLMELVRMSEKSHP